MQRLTPAIILEELNACQQRISRSTLLALVRETGDRHFGRFCRERLNGKHHNYLDVFSLYQEYWRTPPSTPPTMPLYERKSRGIR